MKLSQVSNDFIISKLDEINDVFTFYSNEGLLTPYGEEKCNLEEALADIAPDVKIIWENRSDNEVMVVRSDSDIFALYHYVNDGFAGCNINHLFES